MLERLTFKKFHDDEVLTVKLVHVINCANMRMIQGRSSPCFTLKAFNSQGILRKFFREKLQRNVTAQSEVFRLVHNAHTAAAQLFQNPVMGNGPADHCKETAIGWSY